jgi:hypothetical protein
MRRIVAVLALLLLVLATFHACASISNNDKSWKLSKQELNLVANNSCKYVVKKYVDYQGDMADHNSTRLQFGYILDALRHDHPVNIKDMKYEVLDFNEKKGYLPIKIQCEAIIEPSSRYNSAGLNHHMDIDAKIYKDDFGHYSTRIVRPAYACDYASLRKREGEVLPLFIAVDNLARLPIYSLMFF